MTEERFQELQQKLATAIGLADEVSRVLRSEMGYRKSLSAVGHVINGIGTLSEVLYGEWDEDERDLDAELDRAEAAAMPSQLALKHRREPE